MRLNQFLIVIRMILWKDRLILLRRELSERSHSRDQPVNLTGKETIHVMDKHNLLNKVISQFQATTAVELLIGHRMINVQQEMLLHLPRDLVPTQRLQAEYLGLSRKKLLLRWKQLLIAEGRNTIVFLHQQQLDAMIQHQKHLLEELNEPLELSIKLLRSRTLRVTDQL